jgi:hypothetical protein
MCNNSHCEGYFHLPIPIKMFVNNETKSDVLPFSAAAFAVLLMIILLKMQGRVWWCQLGDFSLWAGDINSSHNSQHFFDPYSFTHILHGVLYFGITALIFRRMKLAWRFFLSVAFGSAWELLENSTFIIERYRAATISLDYFGDSVLNSIADVFCCGLGFWIAYKLGWWKSVCFFLLTEIVLIFWIRDSLLINIIMLVYPVEAIKHWQAG